MTGAGLGGIGVTKSPEGGEEMIGEVLLSSYRSTKGTFGIVVKMLGASSSDLPMR